MAKVIHSRREWFLNLPTLLREWLGPEDGLPVASFEVEFRREGDAWCITPAVLNGGPPPRLLPTW
jgi:hypothetical protein